MTLVYCSKGIKYVSNSECNYGSERPTINQQAFPNTVDFWYWSGSPYANRDNSDLAWGVLFYNGHTSFNDYRNYDSAVRLVRGGK
jgi:hypothetical protein